MNQNTVNALDVIFDVAPEGQSNSEATLVTVNPTPIQAALVPAPQEEETIEEAQAKEDYNFTRSALTTVAADAQTTLHRAVDVANQTDTPRAFEAVAEMVRATIEIHRDLQALHKTAAEIRMANKAAKVGPAGSVSVNNGIIFAGTSEELLRLVSKDRQ